MGWGGLFDYSVKPGPDLSRSRLGLVRLLTRTAKARLAKLVTRLARSRTRLVKARARSLTISQPKLDHIELVGGVLKSSETADFKTDPGYENCPRFFGKIEKNKI